MRISLLLIVALALSGGAARANPEHSTRAELAFSAFLKIENAQDDVQESITAIGNGLTVFEANLAVEDARNEVALALFAITAFVDPFIEYEVELLNGTDQALDVFFAVNLDTSVFNESFTARQTLSIELTDTGGDGASVAPNQFQTIQSVAPAVHLLSPLDVFLLNFDGPVFLGDPVSQAGTTDFDTGVYGVPAVSPALQAGNLWNSLILTVDLTLSPMDEAVLRGRVDVVPEPGVGWLLGSGLVLLGARSRCWQLHGGLR